MTTLYARTDVAEVATPSTVYKTRKSGDQLVVECPEHEVDALLATGNFARRPNEVPRTPDELEELERQEREGTQALRFAGEALARGATLAQTDPPAKGRRR